MNTTAVPGNDAITVSGVSGADNITALSLNQGSDSGDIINVEGVVNVSGTTTLNGKRINLDANVVNAVTGSTATVVNVNLNPTSFVTPPPPLDGQIQDAINVAANNAIVTVASGTYSESPTINRPLVLKSSANAGVSVGVANGGSRPLNEAQVTGALTIGSSGTINIDGFTLSGGIAAAASNGAAVTIENNYVIPSSGNGIDVSATASASIINNGIQAPGDAIHGSSIAGAVTIKNNNVLSADRGVWLSGVQGAVTIGGAGNERNVFNANLATSHEGIEVFSQGPGAVQVVNNVINFNTTGILIQGGSGAGAITIRSNDIISNSLTSLAGVSVSSITTAGITIGGVASGDANNIDLTAGTGVVASSVTGSISVVGNAFGSQFVRAPINGVNANTITGNLTVRGNQIHSEGSAIIA
ncbi:MAG: right-handed parallel beta-helix repeat-containing protein, partial [Planctomycetia bacterium]|nr:right-handed parallel beta-helix repeat-containing protein [Planctomycetia bacterium]